ncbi:MAG: phytoene desaturase family protein [Candidatus Woesearchaeota archaeon]
MEVIVIGSGFGGLSIAALLSKEHKVTLIEKNEQSGGRASMFKQKGFSFDMGPSWYLMPEVFEKFYNDLGYNVNKELNLIKLDPSYRMFFKNDLVDISSDIKKNYKLFEKIEKGSSVKLKKYLSKAKYQYDIAMKEFIYKEYNNFGDILNWRLAVEGSKLNVFQNLDQHVSKYFKNDKIKKILEYTMVFLGGAPKNTPALYSIMSHVDLNLGVFYPMGGLNALAKSMEKICKKNKVKFVFNDEVKQIITKNNKAMAVKTEKDLYKADLVVSNADYEHTEMDLLNDKNRTYDKKYWNKRVIAPSGLILYMGLNKKIKNLKHHNLFLEHDWMEHFNKIFDDPKWPDKFSYYVCCPSKTDKAVAPKGKENIFVLLPVASGIADNEKIREKYKDLIIEDMEKRLGEKFKDNIEYIRIFAQRDFKKRYNAFKGTALGLSHTLMQTALFRPKNKSKKISNLYYTGHYNHPGIGVPMVIISSQILRDRIKNDIRKKKI